MADFNFGEVTRLLYDAIWSEYCDWGLELAKVRLADTTPPGRRARGDLVGARRGARHLPAAAPPGDAVHHRARCGRRSRTARPDPALLIVARWPGAGARDEAAEAEVGALVELVRGVRNARADAKVEPGAWLPLDVYVDRDLGHALEALRPALERLARARPLRRHLTREDLHGTAGAAGGLAVIAGPAEAIVGVAGDGDRGAAGADRARLEKELADAERLLEAARARLANEAFTSKAPPAIVEGARAREAELADQVARLRERLGRERMTAATICAVLSVGRAGGAVPLEFLKRRGGDDEPAQPSQAAAGRAARRGRRPGLPAQALLRRQEQRGRPHEGAGRGRWPSCRRCSPGIARGDVEVVEPLPLEFAQAVPLIVRPSEAMQWLNAHHQLSPITRHALVVLETIDAVDLAFDTFACALLDGETDTSGYPEYNAVVGGVASHWDEATGDMIVRGVVGWGGEGVRGDTDRIASRILGGLLTNILANQYALGLTAVDRPVPAAGRGGLVCAHCGFASGHERAFYCPKCGMRLLRG